MRKILFIFGLALTLIFSAGVLEAAEKKATASLLNKVPYDNKTSYKIGAGDILKVKTWKEPDFSLDEILVRIDGKITFPLLNDVQAAGQSPEELKNKIENRLTDYVSDPVVTVTVINPGSKKFYVLGEVQATGEYSLVKNLTVMQAFALAGGFTEWAEKDEIILIRYERGKRVVHTINYKKLSKGKDLDQDLQIEADDTIIVP